MAVAFVEPWRRRRRLRGQPRQLCGCDSRFTAALFARVRTFARLAVGLAWGSGVLVAARTHPVFEGVLAHGSPPLQRCARGHFGWHLRSTLQFAHDKVATRSAALTELGALCEERDARGSHLRPQLRLALLAVQ